MAVVFSETSFPAIQMKEPYSTARLNDRAGVCSTSLTRKRRTFFARDSGLCLVAIMALAAAFWGPVLASMAASCPKRCDQEFREKNQSRVDKKAHSGRALVSCS
jgi:hypothetical protein